MLKAKRIEILRALKRIPPAPLPNFLIIGTGRGGTSSLFENLALHPQIQCPLGTSYHRKELGFFNKNYYRGLEWYSKKFSRKRPGCLLFEATPTYISSRPEVQDRIKKIIPHVKAILLLRNPTARAWSSYWLNFARPPYSIPIKRLTELPALELVTRGIYVDQIIRWHSLFPKQNLLIIRSEDYFADMRNVLKKIYAFLRIKEIYPAELSKWDPWADKKKKWGYPTIPADIKKWLDDFYRPHNARLADYLGKDFIWMED